MCRTMCVTKQAGSTLQHMRECSECSTERCLNQCSYCHSWRRYFASLLLSWWKKNFKQADGLWKRLSKVQWRRWKLLFWGQLLSQKHEAASLWRHCGCSVIFLLKPLHLECLHPHLQQPSNAQREQACNQPAKKNQGQLRAELLGIRSSMLPKFSFERAGHD